jgi:hypothetical protein
MPKTLDDSLKSAGMDVAPAIILKRMYHCVPSNMRTMLPKPRPTPMVLKKIIMGINSMGAGKEATI